MRKVISVEYLKSIRKVNLPFPRDINNEVQNLTSPSCPRTLDQAPSPDGKGPVEYTQINQARHCSQRCLMFHVC